MVDLQTYSDGGSRGNPGPAAYGFVVLEKNGEVLFEQGKTIGISTNNIAEYSGVIAAFTWIDNNIPHETINSLEVFLDSELVARQLSGQYKVKNETLRNLFHTVKQKEQSIGVSIIYTSIPREKNKQADRLVNIALDNETMF
jgi:ribonuclease HI